MDEEGAGPDGGQKRKAGTENDTDKAGVLLLMWRSLDLIL